jgi:hypothetical protein
VTELAKPSKPNVFISHAHTDRDVVEALSERITAFFGSHVDVTATSLEGVIPPGADWFGEIRKRLASAKVVLFLITPASVSRPWLWFEMGASWQSYAEGALSLLPVCCDFQMSELPAPLNRIQAVSLTETDGVRGLFRILHERLESGSLAVLRPAEIARQLRSVLDERDNTAPLDPAEQKLNAALEFLVKQGRLSESDLDVFSLYQALPVPTIRALKRSAS